MYYCDECGARHWEIGYTLKSWWRKLFVKEKPITQGLPWVVPPPNPALVHILKHYRPHYNFLYQFEAKTLPKLEPGATIKWRRNVPTTD